MAQHGLLIADGSCHLQPSNQFGWWTYLMHAEHGWFARHQYITLAIIFALVVFGPGAIECLP